MTFSEKLFELRKKKGLSQEQLAEKLNVSRQAISKWESGKAIPESETLISISEYFEVSLDFLMKDNVSDETTKEEKTINDTLMADNGKEMRILGLVICIGGMISLIVWGLVSILMPSASDKIGASSMINIDGNGIFMIICILLIISGAVLLLKNSFNKEK